MLLLLLIGQACCSLEVSVFNTISKNWHAEPIYTFMEGVSFVSMPVLTVAPPAILCMNEENEAARQGMVGFLTNCATVIPLKLLIVRERPDGNVSTWNSSFPSGHTTFAFTQAVVYSHHCSDLAIPLYVYATTVGFSRIYLGEHYPTDVLGGAILGLLTGFLTVKLVD
jgi:undecaprenyl-diphosphatase